MGTTGIVRVFEGDTELLCMQQHSDGYPEGLGREVADFCATKRIVNGISSNYRRNAIANGAGCLAAQIVEHFKDGVGGIYICSPGSKAHASYEYHVKCPSFEAVDEAQRANFRTFDGLPIVVEAFSVRGGYGDKPLTLERVKVPDDASSEDEDEAETGSGSDG